MRPKLSFESFEPWLPLEDRYIADLQFPIRFNMPPNANLSLHYQDRHLLVSLTTKTKEITRTADEIKALDMEAENARAKSSSPASRKVTARPAASPATTPESLKPRFSTSPQDVTRECPRSFAAGSFDSYRKPEGEFTCLCKPGFRMASVWGTDTYTDDSSICTAALHAGVIGSDGGTVKLRSTPGRDTYPPSTRNGVTSGFYSNWPDAFQFTSEKKISETKVSDEPTTATAEPASAPPCPATFKSFMAPLGKFQCTCAANYPVGNVWGTDVYTDDSAICTAAMHAGIIDKNGGTIEVKGVSGLESFQASTRNGMTSRSYGRWPQAFTFITKTSMH